MTKYYVTWGKYEYLESGNSPMQACAKVMRKVLGGGTYIDQISTIFRVSYSGHIPCDDDIIVCTKWVIDYQLWLNNGTPMPLDDEGFDSLVGGTSDFYA